MGGGEGEYVVLLGEGELLEGFYGALLWVGVAFDDDLAVGGDGGEEVLPCELGALTWLYGEGFGGGEMGGVGVYGDLALLAVAVVGGAGGESDAQALDSFGDEEFGGECGVGLGVEGEGVCLLEEGLLASCWGYGELCFDLLFGLSGVGDV